MYNASVLGNQAINDQAVKEESEKMALADRFPARIQLALAHQAANKFGVPVHSYHKVCACCDSHIYVKEINCCADLTQIACDPGITVLFNFIRMVAVFLIFLFIFGSAYNLYTNFAGGQCGDPSIPPLAHCMPEKIFIFSPVNKLFNKTAFWNMQLFALLTVLLSILFFILYRKIHYDSYMTAQQLIQNQQEFTLYVTNIPVVMDEIGSVDYENKLTNLLTGQINNWIARNQNQSQTYQQVPNAQGQRQKPLFNRIYQQWVAASQQTYNAPYNNQAKVVDVHLCWDIRQMTQLLRIKDQIKRNIQGVVPSLEQGGQQNDPSSQAMMQKMQGNVQKYFNQLQTVNAEYLKLCFEYKNDQNIDYSEYLANFLGKAFVCFQYQHYAQVARISMKRQDIKMGDNTLRAVWAPSPRDVNWSNLHINPWVRRKKQFISFLILVGAILFSLAIQLGVQSFQIAMQPNPQKPPSKQQIRQFQMMSTVLGFGGSMLLMVINMLLFRAMSQLIVYEKHESITDEQTSLLWKTLVAQFINSALINFVFGYIFPVPIWAPPGIVGQVSRILLSFTMFNTVFKIINIRYVLWKLRTWFSFRNGPLQIPIFQDSFNTMLQLPSFEIGNIYLEYLLNVYIAAFFAFVAPWGSLLVAVTTIVSYFADKCQITQYCSLKTHYSYEMSEEALKLLEFVPFVYILGQIMFSYMFHGPSWILWVALVISLIYPITMNNLPPFLYIRLMSTWLRCEKFSYGYCQANHLFDYTYMNSNPMTRFDSLHSSQQFMKVQEAQQYLQKIPGDQERTIPQYDPVAMSQQQNQQGQQGQGGFQNQSVLGGYGQIQGQSQIYGNNSTYNQNIYQNQNYQLGSQYNNFAYQPIPQ